MLSQDEIGRFLADGFVAVRGAVPTRVVRACQDVIWSELARNGVRRDDPSTWTVPVLRINCPEGGPFVAAGTTPLVGEACDQLLGAGRWWRRPGIGGTIPVRFPSEGDPGDAGWHIEASYETGGTQRVNVHSRGRGLLALYLLTDVDQDSAPTRLRPGSHLDVPPTLAPAGADGLDCFTAAEWAAVASAHRPTALATGRAGDVFLCHLFLVHTASWPHRGRNPRMIAQPPVLLHDEFPLHTRPDASPGAGPLAPAGPLPPAGFLAPAGLLAPAEPPAPVELAILSALEPAATPLGRPEPQLGGGDLLRHAHPPGVGDRLVHLVRAQRGHPCVHPVKPLVG